jgi:APA family basic amino acid/polyamine antiporter
MATQKKLGLFSLISLVTGNMIGSGVFILPADLARIGSISLLSWVFTALGAFMLALVFSKLSHLVVKPGGPYVYVDEGAGKFTGFITAFFYWIYTGVGNVAITVALIGYLRVFFHQLEDPNIGMIVGICILGLIVLINFAGVSKAGMVQLVTTIFKIIPLLVVAIFGWNYFHLDYITNNFNISNTSNISAFSHAATLTLWAFMGIESATVPSGSVENPSRNIPLATLIGTVTAAALYMICSTVIMGIIPAETLANSASPFAAAATVIFGRTGGLIVAAGAVISCFGCLNGWVLIQSQIAMTVADDGLFPKIFAKRNKNNAPGWGLLINFIILSSILWMTRDPNLVSQFQLIILVASTTCLFVYFSVSICTLIILKKHDGVKSKSSKIYVIIAILASLYSLWAFCGAGKEIVYYVTILSMLGSLYYSINRMRSQKQLS